MMLPSKAVFALFDGICMLKKIFLVGALLAPVLAYAGSPSTELSVQIVPAASPIPPPPTSPTPPAAAQALGFTTLAFNIDFTGATTSEYNGSIFNAQNLSSWLDCAGSTSPLFQWQDYRNPGVSICNRISIVNDGGINALNMEYQPGDVGTIADTMMQSANQSGNVASMAFPSNMYFEIKERLSPGTISACPSGQQCVTNDDWSWYSIQPGPNPQELDFVETSSFGTSTNSYTGYGGFSPSNYAAHNSTVYHIFGVRSATDNSTGTQICNYLDNVQSGCSGTITGNYNARLYLIEMLGPQNLTPGAQTPTQNEDFYIEWIHVWSCNSWATTQCTVSPVP